MELGLSPIQLYPRTPGRNSSIQSLCRSAHFADPGTTKGYCVLNVITEGPESGTIRSRTSLLTSQYKILRSIQLSPKLLDGNKPLNVENRAYLSRKLFDVIRHNTHRSYLSRPDFPPSFLTLHQEMERLYNTLVTALHECSQLDILTLNRFSLTFSDGEKDISLVYDNNGKVGGPADKMKGHVSNLRRSGSAQAYLLDYQISRLQSLVKDVLQKDLW